jgi:uncharacterized protein YtpQ (UPF0354 family)
MLLRAALVACLLAALLAGCSGENGEDSASSTLLAPSSFQEVVVAELRGAGLEAEPGSDLEVRATRGPNWVQLDLADAFESYEQDPGRSDELVARIVGEAEQRLDAGVGDTALDDVRSDVMPLLKAPFELRTYGFDPAATSFPGNLAVIYAVDTPEAFTVVQPQDLESWDISMEQLHELAVGNLRRQTNEEQRLLCEPSEGQELCGWASGDGYDATRMIVPGLRRQIVKEYGGPAAYAVPMENVFVALPLELLRRGKTEEAFRTKVERDFQTSEDPLSPLIFVERDGELVVKR